MYVSEFFQHVSVVSLHSPHLPSLCRGDAERLDAKHKTHTPVEFLYAKLLWRRHDPGKQCAHPFERAGLYTRVPWEPAPGEGDEIFGERLDTTACSSSTTSSTSTRLLRLRPLRRMTNLCSLPRPKTLLHRSFCCSPMSCPSLFRHVSLVHMRMHYMFRVCLL